MHFATACLKPVGAKENRMDWYVATLKRYNDFNGRSGLREFWMFFLANLVIGIVLAIVESFLPTRGMIGMLFGLALLVPNIAVAIRRLHDIGKPGIYLLIGLIPIIGLVLIYFFIQPSQPGSN